MLKGLDFHTQNARPKTIVTVRGKMSNWQIADIGNILQNSYAGKVYREGG